MLQRLRAEAPDRTLIVLWDGAPYHRAQAVREVATTLGITLMPLPGYTGLQPGSDAGRGAWALAAGGRHRSSRPCQRRRSDPAGDGRRGAPKPRSLHHRRPTLGSKTASTQSRRNYGSHPRWGIEGDHHNHRGPRRMDSLWRPGGSRSMPARRAPFRMAGVWASPAEHSVAPPKTGEGMSQRHFLAAGVQIVTNCGRSDLRSVHDKGGRTRTRTEC